MLPAKNSLELQADYLHQLHAIITQLAAAHALDMAEQGLVVADCGALLSEAYQQFRLGIWQRPAAYQQRVAALSKLRRLTGTTLTACGKLGLLTWLEFTNNQLVGLARVAQV